MTVKAPLKRPDLNSHTIGFHPQTQKVRITLNVSIAVFGCERVEDSCQKANSTPPADFELLSLEPSANSDWKVQLQKCVGINNK